MDRPQKQSRNRRLVVKGVAAACLILFVHLVVKVVLPRYLNTEDGAAAYALEDFVADDRGIGEQRWALPDPTEAVAQAKAQVAEAVAASHRIEMPPIPFPDDALTETVRQERTREWLQELLVESYRKHGSVNELWDAQVERFLTKYSTRIGGDLSADLLNELQGLSTELTELGCDDPFIVYAHGNLLHHTQGSRPSETFVQRGLEALEESAYPKLYLYWAASRRTLQLREGRGRSSPEANAAMAKELRYLALACTDRVLGQMHRRFVVAQFLLRRGEGTYSWTDVDRLMSLLEQQQEADPWIRDVILGHCHIWKATKSRGTGWGYTVTAKGARGLHSHMGEAAKVLRRAHELRPESPEAASLMMSVALTSSFGDGDVLDWFYRSVKAQPDYGEAYGQVFNALRPRWGGSHAQLLALGWRCLETKRFDAHVPWFFVATVQYVAADLEEHWREAWRGPEIYDAVAKLSANIVRERGLDTPEQRTLHDSCMALASWAAGRYSEAAAILDRLGDRFEEKAYESMTMAPKHRETVMDVDVGAGKLGEGLRRAVELYDGGRPYEALPLFVEGLRDSAKPAEHRVHVYNRLSALALRPETDSALCLVEVLAELGCRERLANAYRSALARQDGPPLPPPLEKRIKEVLGPVSFAFAVTAPLCGPIGLGALRKGLKRVDDTTARLRRDLNLQAGTSGGEELDCQRGLARLRWLLRAMVPGQPRQCSSYVNRILRPELPALVQTGWVLDFLAHQLAMPDVEDILAQQSAMVFWDEISKKRDLETEAGDRIIEELRRIESLSDLESECMSRYARDGSCRLSLLMAQLLRKRGATAAAARLEGLVDRWIKAFSETRCSLGVWVPWQAMQAYNRVAGYEDRVIRHGRRASRYKHLNSSHYMTADALVRKGNVEEGLAELVRGRAMPDDADVFYSPGASCNGTKEYVRYILKQALTEHELSDDWQKWLRREFPEETRWAEAQVER